MVEAGLQIIDHPLFSLSLLEHPHYKQKVKSDKGKNQEKAHLVSTLHRRQGGRERYVHQK